MMRSAPQPSAAGSSPGIGRSDTIGPMRCGAAIVGMVQAATVVALMVGLRQGWFPLGVRGEWEWLRHGRPLDPAAVMIAAAIAASYITLAVAGFRTLKRRATRSRVGCWLTALVLGAVGVQVGMQFGAPAGYGLVKWTTLGMTGSSGYLTTATQFADGPGRFLKEYPAWITRQDALHIGTHPPGLFVLAHGARRVTAAFPITAERIDSNLPASLARGFRVILGPQSVQDRMAMVLLGAMTLVACAATVVPLYALSRGYLEPAESWAVASLWPLVPSAILFQPTADTWFPLLSTSALALAMRSSRGGVSQAFVAGIILAIGMQLSLVFLAVGLVVAIMVLATDTRTPHPNPLPVGGERGPDAFLPVDGERSAPTRPGEGSRRTSEPGASAMPDIPRLGPHPAAAPPLSPRGRGLKNAAVQAPVRLAMIGLGFLATTFAAWAATRANPFAIWITNARNHARFYEQFPRSYWPWVVANPIETAVAIGLPCIVWGLIGLSRRGPVVSWATLLVLVILTLSGRNLSEAARLWLPFFPALLVASGRGMERLRIGRVALAVTLVLLAVQTLALQAVIQVVYPV